jgi:hypothetical protein
MPIETLGEVGKAVLTGGKSTVLKQVANAAGTNSIQSGLKKPFALALAPLWWYFIKK